MFSVSGDVVQEMEKHLETWNGYHNPYVFFQLTIRTEYEKGGC